MTYFSWLGQEQALSSEALTVRAQTVSPNDRGRLFWDIFFPPAPADSTKIATLSDVDYRPTADRREWNARGRLITFITPGTAEMEFIPIEAFFRIDEYEINKIQEQVLGNVERFRTIIGSRIPDRVDRLAESIYRRTEVDAMTAWALNAVTVKNPVSGAITTVPLGIDATRYEEGGVTAGAAAWTTSNAYSELLLFLRRAQDRIGGLPEGVMLRQVSYDKVQTSAPIPTALSPLVLTRAQLLDRIQQDLGQSFRFVIREDSLDIANDGGLDVTRTKVWPANYVAVIPPGGRVGTTYQSPVTRAYQMAGDAGAEINVRGINVFREATNGGRELTVEAQANFFSVPNEQLTYVLDAKG